MLPDNYENTAQSVVATNFFGNNILESITTKNYWDVGNDYKPLMHTWYVGLLMQYYVFVPFLLFFAGNLISDANKRRKVNIILTYLLGLISLLLYIVPGDACAKFYYLPYRLYEFCAGSLMYYLFAHKNIRIQNSVVKAATSIIYFGIIILVFVELDFISRPIKLLTIVGLTALLIDLMSKAKIEQNKIFSNKQVALIGAASYSIFVWHQVIFALTRYSFTNNLTEVIPFLSVIGLTAVLSVLSYKYIEHIKEKKMIWTIACAIAFLTTSFSLYIYTNAGVVRDVPELDVVKGNVHRGMWAEYCDRGYKYDKDFTESSKPKWYVIGNSFGRDMVNIILESPIADKVDVAYSTPKNYQNQKNRFAKADVVFLSTLGLNNDIIDDVHRHCSANTKFFIIGEKNFGECNGQVYRHRYSVEYHKQTIGMEEGYAEKNEQLKKAYPNCFIDLIEMVRQPNGKVRVFSDDGKFISQDCRHLTKAGAKFYADRINWSRFLK